MCAGSKPSDVGEIQILRDEKTSIILRSRPDNFIRLTFQTFIYHRVGVVPEAFQNPGQRGR